MSGDVERPVRIGVIGSSHAGDELRAVARGVGRALARAGAVVICGGLGGVMEAAAAGAADEGGPVVGFLPGDDPDDAAAGVTVPVATDMGQARNVLVVRASEAVIAVGGAWGTKSEATLCMKLDVPLVGVMDALGDSFPIERVRDPEAGVARALELAGKRRRRR